MTCYSWHHCTYVFRLTTHSTCLLLTTSCNTCLFILTLCNICLFIYIYIYIYMVRLATHSTCLLLTTSCNTCLFILTSRSICFINLDIPQHHEHVFITLKITGCVFISRNILEHMLYWKKPHCGAYPPLSVYISSHLIPHALTRRCCHITFTVTSHFVCCVFSALLHVFIHRSCDAVDVIVFHLMIEGSGLPVTQLCEPECHIMWQTKNRNRDHHSETERGPERVCRINKQGR